MQLLNAYLMVAAGVLLLPGGRHRALGGAGLVVLGLALAAFGARFGQAPLLALAEQVAVNGAPLGFLQVNAGLMVAGGGASLLAALLALRSDWRCPGSLAGAAAVAAGLGVSFWALGPVARYAGAGQVVLATGAVVLIGLSLSVAVTVLRPGAALARLDAAVLARRETDVPAWRGRRADLAWLLGFYLCAAAVALADRAEVVLGAALAGALAAHVLLRRAGGGTPVPLGVLLACALLPLYRYLAAIGAGPPGLSSLAATPLSPAAEILLSSWLLLAAWGLAGFWPLHGLVPAGGTAFLGGLLVLRLSPAFPEGLAHWAPVLFPVAVATLWHAALTTTPDNRRRRLPAALVALAVIGTAAGTTAGAWGAAWLVGAAAAYPLLSAAGDFLPPLPLGAQRLLWLPVVRGALLAVEAGLGLETLYTVLGTAALAAMLLGRAEA